MQAKRRRPAATAGISPIGRDSLLTVIAQNVDGMLVIDGDGLILLANPAAERLLGQPATGLKGTPFGAPLGLDEATEIDVIAAGTPRTAEMRVVEIDWHGTPAFLASLRDVTDRKLAEGVLARVGGQHAAIAQLGEDAVSGLPPDALMAEAARHVQRVLATDFAGVLALAPGGAELRLAASEWLDAPGPDLGAAGSGSQPRYTLEASEPVVMEDAAGETRFAAWPPGVASAATVLIQDREQSFGVVQAASRSLRGFDRDEITFLQSIANLLAAAVARFRAETQVRHQALHDPLTGLPNRALFVDRLTHALARSSRSGHTGLVVLFADLDGFKHINDSLGHHAGDALLVSLAERLSAVMRTSDSLARFGGDEFMVLFEDLEGEEELRLAVDRIQAAVTAVPFVVGGQSHALNLTIGLVRADESHTSPGDMVRDADAAMYRAKQLGHGGYAVFDREMRENAVRRLQIEQELRAAIDGGELRLAYQPIVSLETGRIVELEALLRWQHPERGLLEPADFLEAAIESRLILPIGKWALPEACRQAAAWREAGIATITLNFNMAPSELAQPELRRTIRAAIDQRGGDVPLQLELTEGALIEDPSLPATLRDLSGNLGVRVALDDFGTGYSSLAYLTRFKIDELKIDQSFVRTLARERDAPIVSAIVNMAHALDILVVAEGIESEEQATEARRLGCDRGQGRFFSYPLSPEAIPSLIAEPRLPAPLPP